MLVYKQSTGELRDGHFKSVGLGYSGRDDGKNNPIQESTKNIGPLPKGYYLISPPRDTESHGPFVLPLVPDPDNSMFDRSGFLIHGDSISHPGRASDGCIIMGRTIREAIWNQQHRILQVIP